MKTFKVELWEEMGGYIDIEAETEAEAKQKGLEEMFYNGMKNTEVTHRDAIVFNTEEIIKK